MDTFVGSASMDQVTEASGEPLHGDNGDTSQRVAPRCSKEKSRPLGHADAVKAINAELRKQDGGNLRVGEIVDRVIGPTGRADYGKGVIASLAEAPELMCDAEHLRRCWHYYRLMRDHGATLAEYPVLKFGHLYQIARLLGCEKTVGADEVTKAIRAMARHAMETGKDGKPEAADALARAVTTHIKMLKGEGDEHGVAHGSPADERDAIQDAMDALTDGIGTVQEAADRISQSGQYRQAARLQADVERMAQAYIAVLGHIVTHDPQSMVIPMARKRVVALARLVGLTVVDAASSEQDEVRA